MTDAVQQIDLRDGLSLEDSFDDLMALFYLCYSCLVIEEGLKYIFYNYAFTEISELVSQVYFFLCSCTLGDTFKSAAYAVLINLGVLFLW